jgi:predicted restriction endonuclease
MKRIKENKSKKDKTWATFVKDRANYACEVCGQYSKFANAHHILPKPYAELRWDVKNGICLCPRCHRLSKTAAHQNSIFFCLWLEKNKPETLAYLRRFLKL